MKKFFSLLCATLLVFSASAAPVAKKAEIAKKAPVAVEQMQKVQFEKAQIANFNQLSATPAVKVNNQKAQAPAILGKKVVKANHEAAPQVAATPAKAPAAVAEDVNVTAIDWEYDDKYQDVYVASETETYIFELQEALEYGKTYTYADMVSNWVGTLDDEGYIEVAATDATLTVTKDQDDLIHIAATMVLEGVTHVISYDEKPFVPSGVQIPLNGTELTGKYNSWYYMYIYTAKVGENEIQIAFDATAEQATYTKDQVLTDYCVYVSPDYSTYVEFVKAASDFTVTTTETTKTLAGSLYAENGDEYILNLVYEKPKVESISVLVEDATMTKKTLFFQVDGNDTENAYGITVRVNSKVLEGEFTLDNCEPYHTGVTDLSTKKWFDTDSCYIQTQMLGSNTLLMQGILYTHNTALDRYINAEFVLTARVDANGELMDIYGGIIEPAKGDTISLTRSEEGTAFFKNPSTGGLAFGAQSGKATMVAVNDSAYYWYNPISKLTTGYWIKGIKDKAANTINFDTAQVINVYNGGTFLGLMKWMKATTAGKLTTATDGAKQFVLDINEDTLTLHGSAPFDMTQDIYFPGVVVPGYGFQGYGDAGTILTVNKPILERDTVDVISNTMTYNDFIASNQAVQFYAGEDAVGYSTFLVTSKNATSVEGTFDIYVGYSFANPDEGDQIGFEEGKITVASEEKGIRLTGWVIGNNEKYYRLNWFKQTVFDERDTVTVNANTLMSFYQGNPVFGTVYQSSNADYELIQFVTKSSEKLGTFAAADINFNYSAISADGETNFIFFQDGEITVSEDKDGFKLTGLMIGKDEKAYVLNLVQPAGTLEGDTDAPFDATFAYSDMSADLDEGVISIGATNAEGYKIGLELYADPTATAIPAGTYTISDTQEAGTALQSIGLDEEYYLTKCWAGTLDEEGYIDDCWFMVEGTITLSYDEYGKLKVVVDAKNSYGQPVTALVQYEKLEPKSSVDIDNAEFSVYEGYMEKYGIVYFYGGNDNYGFDLYAYGDTIVGDFANTIDFKSSILESADGELSIIDVYSFNVAGEGKNLTLTASFLGSDTIQYNISATGYYGYIQGDAVEGYVGEFAMENVTLLQATKSQVMINGFNEAGDTVAIVFDAKFSKTAGTIVEPQAGEYEAIMASTGFTAEYDVYPSFVGNADAVWFIQSGKLIIAEDGSMAFAGVNSYDAPVAIDFTVPATGLRNTKANVKAAKQIKNGQIVIVRENKEYNILGAAL